MRGRLRNRGRVMLAQEPEVRLDYFEIVDPETLDPLDAASGKSLVAVAAYVGSTRLIDNVVLGAPVSLRPDWGARNKERFAQKFRVRDCVSGD